MRITESESILAGETLEGQKLEDRLRQVQGKIRCVHRAVYAMTVLTGLALAGLCYCTIFLPDFPQTMGLFLMQFAVKACCALAMASLLCLLAFSILEFVYRRELNQQRRHMTPAIPLPPTAASVRSPAVTASPPAFAIGQE